MRLALGMLLIATPIGLLYGKIPASKYTINSLYGFLHVILPKRDAKIEEIIFIENTSYPTTTALTYGFLGVTDALTFIPTIPIINSKVNEYDKHPTGLGPVSLQFNYLLYQKEKEDFRYRFISTAGIGFPTMLRSVTPFSLKAVNSFIGVMQDLTTPDWFFYTDFGGILVGHRKKANTHNFILYAAGVGRNFYLGDHSINILVETLGVYQKRENYFYIGPSIRYFHKNFFVHVGMLATAVFAMQPREKPSNFLAGFGVGFYF